MKIRIKTAREVKPTIYAYTTPDVTTNDGWTKIGYTERDADTRIKEQTGTARIRYVLEWTGAAVFDGEPNKAFTDKDFHAYLRKFDIPNEQEWFEVKPTKAHQYFVDFKVNRGVLKKISAMPYSLRGEQNEAVESALEYFHANEGGAFLWNAKPRFGKTLATYDLCRRAKVSSVLIVTNRPAIANSWYDDYVKFFGGGDWLFVSEVDALKDKKFVLSRADFHDEILRHEDAKCIEFVSLQDLKGSKYFGGEHDKLAEVAEMNWDILVVDEAHEGVDTYKTDVAFDRIKRRFTLHLSGTPFKALAKGKFPQAAIYNWTYADEQAKKLSWDEETDSVNPYGELPSLNLYTYQMSEIVRDELASGINLDGTSVEYAFDLNEFFRTDSGKFVYEASVDKFLDALTTQKKFPFSTPELRDELRHTFWLLNRVESARLLAAKLKAHPTFRDYEIVLAAGDGKIDDDENKKSYDKVIDAIKHHERTITLSVGQLTTGVTVPQWTGVLMLANMKSPALYVQAAFRAQNPCLFKRGENFLRKENAYVFDFDPARTLTIYEAFANDLASDTGGGRGDSETRKANVRELLNFFPVIGEDDSGELIELDAEKVLSIPRKIRAVEVVNHGFMSDFLFQNIAHVFNASAEVVKIIERFPAVEEVNLQDKVQTAAQTLYIDDNGEVSLPADYVIGTAVDVFGEKVYGTVEPVKREVKRKIKDAVKDTLNDAKKYYGKELSAAERTRLERQLDVKAQKAVEKIFTNHDLDKKYIERQRKVALKNCNDDVLTADEINAEFDRRQQDADDKFQAALPAKVKEIMTNVENETVERIETKIQAEEKKSVEDNIRDHLRGFTRTIPSFLMAYGDIDNPVTLAAFDTIIPDDVFQELTSITLDEFRYLRDEGKLFDEVTFNDSVKEFLRLRRELADYFDETHDRDIFDYIPPQKTNQIFTDKDTVQKMLALAERENPGCFDDPDRTFVDLYMKSGTFAAGLVKRLYRSPRLKELYPDKADRLRHIFAAQVYGLAPTEIIFRIVVNYVLGLGISIDKHNLRKADALDAAKDDSLDKLLEELYD